MNKPESEAINDTRQPGLAPGTCSAYWPLFKHMSDNHGLTLLDSEIDDICQVVLIMRDPQKCQWGSFSARASHRDKAGDLLGGIS